MELQYGHKKEAPAGAGTPPERGPQERRATVDTKKSSVWREQEKDHHPHACYGGIVYLTYTVFDEAVGEEVERIEVIPSRRCNDRHQYQEKANTTHRI
jgi:hypothetical protein